MLQREKVFLFLALLLQIICIRASRTGSSTLINKSQSYAYGEQEIENQILMLNLSKTVRNEKNNEKMDTAFVQGIKSRKPDFKKDVLDKTNKMFALSEEKDLFSFDLRKRDDDKTEKESLKVELIHDDLTDSTTLANIREIRPPEISETNMFSTSISPEQVPPTECIKAVKATNQRKENENFKEIRKQIKLTAKQALIMNQVLSTYAISSVDNSLCNNHMSEFKNGLRAFEPWALKMFDSSSKLMSGILNGNLAELGAFKQCLNIYENTVYGPIRGRHCSLKITPTDKLMEIILSYRQVSKKKFKLLKQHVLDGTHLIWSVCVPDSCSYEEVLMHYNKTILETTKGLNLSISLKREHCLSLNDLPTVTYGDIIYILFVASVVAFEIIITLVDIFYKDRTHIIISLFSLKRNANILFSTSESRNEITCMHGLRFISMFHVVAGHRYVHNMATPVVNSMDLVDWVESYFSTVVHGGTVSVDTFLFVSSTLLSYKFCGSIAKGARFHLLKFYLYRHSRIIMPLILAVATNATIMKHFGNGPLYFDFTEAIQKPCNIFWWSAILTIQPFINPTFLCITQTWYLSVDMFWYYLSPLILFPLIRKPIMGYIIFIITYIVSIGMNFYIAWTNKFDGGLPVTRRVLQSDYFAYHYIQPFCRGSPYILGLAFGHALFKTKDQKITIALFARSVGWILVSFCFLSVILINHLFHKEDYEYNRLFSSLFLSCHRSIWTLCLMWIVWCSHHGQGGVIHTILSYGIFKILGRLVYNIYLFHYFYQGAMQNSQKTPGYFSNFLAIYMSLADIVLMVILSLPLTLFFEYPFVRMFGSWIRSSSKDDKVAETTNNPHKSRMHRM